MKNNIIKIILFLSVAFGAALVTGPRLRPENFQLNGTLTVLESGAPAGISQVGEFNVEWTNEEGGQLIIHNEAGKVLWQTLPGEAFITAASAKETVTENRGMFQFKDAWRTVCGRQTVDLIQDTIPGESTSLSGYLHCNDGTSVLYVMYIEPSPTNTDALQVSMWLLDEKTYEATDQANRVFITYQSEADEHFFGFGEQFTYFDMKGKEVPIWVSEQGVGRGEEPITTGANLTNGGAGGNAFTSYAPMPFYITSQMRALSLNNAARSVFDLRQADRVQIEVWSPTVIMQIYDGNTPTELIAAFTSDKRMMPLPDWVHRGAIVGMQGGSEKVETVSAELEARSVPISAYWLQDWVGQRTTSFGKQLWWNWEVDYDRYPRWDAMVAEFNANDVQVMVYASPYIADIADLKPNLRRNLFQEARKSGYLIQDQVGAPYYILNTDFYFSMIDLTNPEAWQWYKQVLKDQVIASGASGWMADFGEGLPYDAMLYEGDARIVHNQYPVLWAKLNREVAEETGKEVVFFNRAAYTQSPAYSTLFWAGDQLVSWSEYDGIKSAVSGLNSGGISGMAFNHSDIGGYTTITNPIADYHRSRELLYRWMELNAFTLIFRTHEGNQPDNNVQFYTDAETLDTFAYWSKVYAALFEYRQTLVQEAAETGLPVVRHPFIHYPDDPETWKITHEEFMLGTDFLIAPVTDEGATEVSAYLPAGSWVHLWSGETYPGGAYVTVPAPLGQPGVFYLSDSTWAPGFVETLKSDGLLK